MLSYKFKNFFYFYNKYHWNFNMDCIESVYGFMWDILTINFSTPWAQNVFPFVCVTFYFFGYLKISFVSWLFPHCCFLLCMFMLSPSYSICCLETAFHRSFKRTSLLFISILIFVCNSILLLSLFLIYCLFSNFLSHMLKLICFLSLFFIDKLKAINFPSG